ncbi:hypothetical protein [Desulfovibrio litoralis]|uniref:DUF4292 domain-containing protein n=1 Tax=Desulfovibrio litoralis DSM 11393 TaxID=1121455 RepID=A0A1M7SY85_9BACT|nr:hypothetical protein [Desulfovibrio litoralis]SHN63361.1 hypothetical protein SAMN02745728_01367 [Desulfovibrio litoralis DSM 11393]
MYCHNYFNRLYKVAFLFALLLNMSACTLFSSKQTATIPNEQADLAWKKFTERSSLNTEQQGGFNISSSLKIVHAEKRTFVQTLLWGNVEEEHCRLRLDLRANIGVTLAKISEHANELLIFMPEDNKAALSYNSGLTELGIPIPFSLCELAHIIRGQEADILLPKYQITPIRMDKEKSLKIKGIEEATVTYLIPEGAFKGRIAVNAEGFPIMWQSDEKRDDDYENWNITFYFADYLKQGKMLKKLIIDFPKAKKNITFTIKERGKPNLAYTDAQLDLVLPPHITIAPLNREWLENTSE